MRVVIDGEREEEQPSKASWLIQVMPAGRTHMRVADEPMGPCGRGHENADGAAGPQEQAELIKYINPLPDPWRLSSRRREKLARNSQSSLDP